MSASQKITIAQARGKKVGKTRGQVMSSANKISLQVLAKTQIFRQNLRLRGGMMTKMGRLFKDAQVIGVLVMFVSGQKAIKIGQRTHPTDAKNQAAIA